MNKDNQYKTHIFIVILFVLIIVFTSGLAYSQTKSEFTNWLRKYVYLYELPNTSPKQFLLKLQSDLFWHSLLLTEKGNYWYQLSPDSEQQFPAFAQAMLDVKVEYNEMPTNIKAEDRIWAFREAINAPKGSGPFGPLAMGYFVEKLQRVPFSTLIVDNISFELINITKILESKAPSSDKKKLLANFGLEKANAKVLDFEQMRQDKTLIKGEPAFQKAYFQQIQSLQPITKTTKSSDDITFGNNMKVAPMILVFFIIMIVLGFLGWLVIYYKTRLVTKNVKQSLSEFRQELERVAPKSIHSEDSLSQLKSDFAGIISAQNEKISRLGGNIVVVVEQLKKLCQMMFDIREQTKQFDEKLTKAGDISATDFENLSSIIKTQSEKISELEDNIIEVTKQLKENQDATIQTAAAVGNLSSMITGQSEKISGVMKNIIGIEEQLRENQDIIIQKMFDMEEQVIQINQKLTRVDDIPAAFENLLSQFKSGFAKIIKGQNEQVSGLEKNIVRIVEQSEENQDIIVKLHQMIFDIAERVKQFDLKPTESGDISFIAQQWEDFKGKCRSLENELHSIADVINQLRRFADKGILTQLEQLVDEKIKQLAPELTLLLPEEIIEVIADAAIESKIYAVADIVEEIEEKIFTIEERCEEFQSNFRHLPDELDSMADIINKLSILVSYGVLTRLEQLAPKLQETETTAQRLKNIDETTKTTIEHLATLWQGIGEYNHPEANSAIHSDITSLELDIKIKENEEGKIRRGRNDNPIVVSLSNPNQFSMNITDIRIDFTNLKTSLPLAIPPKESLRIEANFDASDVKEKKVEVSCYVSYEGHGVRQEKKTQIELETIGVYVQSLDDEFEDI